MVHASTPADYDNFQHTQIQVQTTELVTQSGLIASGTKFLEVHSEEGVKIGGQ